MRYAFEARTTDDRDVELHDKHKRGAAHEEKKSKGVSGAEASNEEEKPSTVGLRCCHYAGVQEVEARRTSCSRNPVHLHDKSSQRGGKSDFLMFYAEGFSFGERGGGVAFLPSLRRGTTDVCRLQWRRREKNMVQ